MPSDKAAYLAAHYLTSSSKPPSSSTKKRKRKQPTSSSGLLITDDDETGWGGSANQPDADDDDAPLTVAGATTDFRRTKKSGWKTLGGGTSAQPPTTTTTTTSSTAASTAAAAADDADAIIASAAAESAAAAAAEAAEDLQPSDPSATPQMSNGALAGLQSASALTAQLRKRQLLEAAELAQLRAAAPKESAHDQVDQVILRDATGRRVDASLRRAEARRQAAEAERAERARKDLLTGEVQQAAARQRRERLEEVALQPVARGKDDVALNEELKREERWNDPMAEFMEPGAGDGGGGGSGVGGKKKKGVGRRPVYKGAAAPNRYGIRPGYRWDGVDRGNGFEAERFKALNRRERDKGLEYAWQMDV